VQCPRKCGEEFNLTGARPHCWHSLKRVVEVMRRKDDLDYFYKILQDLRGRLGGYRSLHGYTGKSG
jgi:hypothetical protein